MPRNTKIGKFPPINDRGDTTPYHPFPARRVPIRVPILVHRPIGLGRLQNFDRLDYLPPRRGAVNVAGV